MHVFYVKFTWAEGWWVNCHHTLGSGASCLSMSFNIFKLFEALSSRTLAEWTETLWEAFGWTHLIRKFIRIPFPISKKKECYIFPKTLYQMQKYKKL